MPTLFRLRSFYLFSCLFLATAPSTGVNTTDESAIPIGEEARPQVQSESAKAVASTPDLSADYDLHPDYPDAYTTVPAQKRTLSVEEKLWRRYEDWHRPKRLPVMCTHPDYAALMAFYNATGGPNWIDNTGWVDGAAGTDCDPCGWYGVSCSGGRVTCLDLDGYLFCGNRTEGGNNLSGSIDFGVNGLPFLETLHLSENNISGEIPEASMMPELDAFWCHDCSFSGETPQFEGFDNLERIIMHGNQFTSLLDFPNSSSLLLIDFRRNDLSGAIPDLSGVPVLETLMLDENELTSIPDFSYVQNLRTLWCSENQLLGNIPDFTNLPLLETLWVHNNQLTGTIPDFSNLASLSSFYCGYNQLTGTIPDFSNMPNLSAFSCGYNQLTGTIPDFSNMPNLSAFSCGYNQLTGTIPDFSSLPSLSSFSCLSNQLSGEIPNFSSVPNLSVFDCSRNDINGSIPNFSNTPILTSLSCEYNNLTGGIPDFSNLSSLISLFCQGNELTGAIPALSSCPELLLLFCFRNDLSGCYPDMVCNITIRSEQNSQLPWQGDETNFCNGEPQTGAPCNDSAPATENDQIQPDCSCAGELPVSCPTGTTYTVTTTADSGPGSLRQGIECANADASLDNIRFDPLLADMTIQLASELPTIEDEGVSIISDNGYINIDGINLSGIDIGLQVLSADNLHFSGLRIINFPNDGIRLSFSSNYLIDDCIFTNNSSNGLNEASISAGGVIQNCTFSGSAFGLQVNLSSNVQILNCIVSDCQRGIIHRGSSNVEISNSSIYDCTTVGIDARNCTGLSIVDNYFGTNPSFASLGIEQAIRVGTALEPSFNVNIQSNDFAFANNNAVVVSNGSDEVVLSQNRFSCNNNVVIQHEGSANQSISPPTLTLAATNRIEGTATGQSSGTVEVYRVNNDNCGGNTVCQGSEYLGTVNVGDGAPGSEFFTFTPGTALSVGDRITVLTIDDSGTRSSEFSNCLTITGTCPDIFAAGPISGCGSPATYDLTQADADLIGGQAGVFVEWYEVPATGDPVLISNPASFQLGGGSTGVEARVSDGSCQSAAQAVSLSAGGVPAATTASLAAEYCAGESISVTVNISGGTPPYSGEFFVSGTSVETFSNFAGGDYSFIFTQPVGNYNYLNATFPFVTDAEGCTSTAVGNGAFTVTAPPTVIAPATSPLCLQGGMAIEDLTQYDNDLGGGEPVQWFTNAAATQSIANPAAYTFMNSGDVELYVVVGVGACASAPVAVTFRVTDPPLATPVALPAEVCAGQDITVTVNISGGTPPYSGDFFISPSEVEAFTGFAGGDYTFTFSLPVGDYSYTNASFPTVQDANGCFNEASGGGSITVTSSPTITAPATAPVCNNSFNNPVDLTQYDNVLGGGAQVQWFEDQAAMQVVGDPTAYLFTSNGNFDLYAVVGTGSCTSDPVAVAFTIIEPPAVSSSPTLDLSGSFCLGDELTTTLTFSGGTPPYTGEITTSQGNLASWSDITGFLEVTLVLDEADDFDYTDTPIFVMDANGCSASISTGNQISYSVVEPPMLSCSSAPADAGRSNGSITLEVTSGQGPYSYVMTPEGVTGNFSGSTTTVTGLAAGDYEVELLDENSNCLDNCLNSVGTTGDGEQLIFSMPGEEPLTFSTNAESACAAFIRLDDPTILLGGGCTDSIELNASVFLQGTNEEVGPFPVYLNDDEPEVSTPILIGSHIIRYRYSDNCGQIDSTDFNILVVDDTAPVAVCKDDVSINIYGSVLTITPDDIDDNSYDNCTENVQLNIARVTAGNIPIDRYSEAVSLSCFNVGTVRLGLRVRDDEGRENFCWRDVEITDNSNNCSDCSDGVQTGTELGVDCGGQLCDPCIYSNNEGLGCGGDTELLSLCAGDNCVVFEGNFTCVDLAAWNFTDISYLDVHLYFDRDSLEWIQWMDAGELSSQFYSIFPLNGSKPLNFRSEDGTGDSVPDGTSLGTMCFRKISSTPTVINIDISFARNGLGEYVDFLTGNGEIFICEYYNNCNPDGIQNGEETGIDCGGPSCPPCSNSCDHVRDSLALVEFYNDTDGMSWDTSLNWLTNLPIQEWFGVGVGPEGCVDTLDLDGINDNSDTTTPGGIGIARPIPDAIGGLRNLKYLFLTDNFSVGGGLPDTLYTLPELRHLFVENMELTEPISPDLINLTELSVFDITFNRLNISDLLPAVAAYAAIEARGGSINLSPQDTVLTARTVTANEGEDITLELVYELNDNRNIYRWYRDDILVDSTGGGTGELAFTNLTLADAGTYYARIGHPDLPGVELSAFGITLIVNPPCPTPELTVSGNRATGVLGGQACITLTADTFPDLDRLSFSVNFPQDILAYASANSLTPEGDVTVSLVEVGMGNLGVVWDADFGTSFTADAVPLVELCFDVLSVEEATINFTNRPSGVGSSTPLNCNYDVLFGTPAVVNAGVVPTCSDGVQNGMETRVDCGGADCEPCSGCDRIRDSLALVALYTATNGLGWADQTGWLTSAPLEEWFGVTTNGECVIEINLEANTLTGVIPPEIGDLSSLVRLRLNSNTITGIIPVEVGRLSELELLYLSNNQLVGVIPEEIGNLTNLRFLHFGVNFLEEEIPVRITELLSLELLLLYSNQLDGTIPSGLGSLNQLRRIELYNNQLSGIIPRELGALSNLRVLALNDNELSGGIPIELGGLNQLMTLSLSENQLEGTIPSTLGQLDNLEDLLLADNNLTGEIPSALANLINISRLYLNGNNLSGCVTDDFYCALPEGDPTTFSEGYSFLNNPLLPFEGDLAQLCGNGVSVGATCNDSNSNTFSDVIQPDCVCGCPEAIPVLLDTVLCEGESIIVNDTEYSLDNPIGEERLTTLTGCDSLIQVDIDPPTILFDSRSATICGGETYEFYGLTYTTAGIYMTSPTCDSVVQLTLDTLPNPRRSLERLICTELEPNFSLTIGGETFDSNNDWGEVTIPSPGDACDSIITVNLIFQEPEVEVQDITTCFGAPLTVNGTPLTADQPILYDTLIRDDQCNLYREIRLTFRNDFDTLRPVVCDEEIYLFEGVEYSRYNPTGVYISTTQDDAQGCNLTTFIEVIPSETYDSTLITTLCANEFIMVGSERFDRETPTGQATLSRGPVACDTIVEVALSFDPLLRGSAELTACAGSTITFRGLTLTEGNPVDSIIVPAPANSGDCDSLLVVSSIYEKVVVNPEFVIGACPGETVTVGGRDYDDPGVYSDTLRSVRGCDSVINTVRIEALIQYADTTREAICQGETIEFAGVDYTETGFYDQVLQSIAGCDSTITLDLRVIPSYMISIDTTLCCGDFLNINGTIYDKENPTDTLDFLTLDNCDSIVIIALDFYPEVQTQNISVTLCAGDSLFYQGEFIGADPGGYEEIVLNEQGCDSLQILWDVDVVEVVISEERDTICRGETLLWRGLTLRETDVYEITEATTDGGCDTLFRMDLKVIGPGDFFLQDDSYEFYRSDEFILLDVLRNDSLLFDYQLAVPDMSEKGRLEMQGDSVIFTPNEFSSGPDSFIYEICLEQCPDVCEEAQVQLSIKFDCELEFTLNVPNGFTPNGDGVNEFFDPLAHISGDCLNQLGPARMVIKNIQSEIVFKSEDGYRRWNGNRPNLRPLPVGTYWYVLEFENQEEPIRGMVELVR